MGKTGGIGGEKGEEIGGGKDGEKDVVVEMGWGKQGE